ncbi:MAG: hypothetical protein RJA70_846 [Pseudomonadota bacterium]|jgi:two-component system chemotaxis response regulator CheY
MRVLVVEDSEATRAFVRAVLESLPGDEDMEVVEASGGFEALRLLPRGPYDLVISDINMPDINGLELLNFIRKSPLHQKTQVLLMSTQAAAKDRDRGMALGANAYLTKPFSPEGLRDALRSLTLGTA